MARENYGEDEEDNDNVRLDQFEHSLVTLTSMVSQLLAVK
jgi:hypothetical protein